MDGDENTTPVTPAEGETSETTESTTPSESTATPPSEEESENA